MIAGVTYRTTKPVKRTVHVGVVVDNDGTPQVYVAGNPKALAEKVARLYVLYNMDDLVERDPSYAEMRAQDAQWAADFTSLYERFGNGLHDFPPDDGWAFHWADNKDVVPLVGPEIIRRAIRAGAAEEAVVAYFRMRQIERGDSSMNGPERYYTVEQTADFRR